MVDKELLAYIKVQLAQGVARESLIQELLKSGWKVQDINEALNVADPVNSGFSKGIEQTTVTTESTDARALDTPILTDSLPGVFALLKQGFSIYRFHIKTITGIVLIQLLPGISLSVLAYSIELANSKVEPSAPMVIGAIILMVLGTIVTIALSLWAAAAIMCVVSEKERIGVAEAFHHALPKIKSIIWVHILLFLIAVAVLFISGIFAGVIVALNIKLVLSNMAPAFFYDIGTGIAILVPALALLTFGTFVTFSNWIVVDGKARGIDAIVESRLLVRGRFWAVFWRVFWVVVFFSILAAIFIILGTLITVLARKLLLNIDILPSLIGAMVITPAIVSTFYAFYVAVRDRQNIATDTAGGRKWFMALAIVGIVAMIIVVVALPLLFSQLIKFRMVQSALSLPKTPQEGTIVTQSQLNSNGTSTQSTKTLSTTAYVNAARGYEFNPPKGWVDIKNDGQFYNPDSDSASGEPYHASIGMVSINIADKFTDIDEWFSGYQQFITSSGGVVVTREGVTISGIPAVLASTRVEKEGIVYRSSDLFVLHNNKVYIMIGFSLDQYWSKYKTVFRESLLSLKLY